METMKISKADLKVVKAAIKVLNPARAHFEREPRAPLCSAAHHSCRAKSTSLPESGCSWALASRRRPSTQRVD